MTTPVAKSLVTAVVLDSCEVLRSELHRDAASAAPDDSPHVLAVEVERGACADLRARGGESVAVTLSHAYEGRPRDTADTAVALDLAELVDRACA